LLGFHQGLRPSLIPSLIAAAEPPGPATNSEDIAMEYIIGGVTTLFLFIYLLYALLRPEKF
jgi:K+-transporting ATPase KdpF subunit